MMKKYITKQSSIKGAGKGLFTNAFFKKGEVIGLAHVDGQPTKEIGSNHNHSEKNPTANNIKNGNKRYLIASKNLNPGEEITTNYRLQPELEQPEDFKKKKGGSMTPQKDGYRTYSPFKNLPYIDVKSDTIDSNNIAYDLKLKANNGLTKFIEKNTGLHTLPGAKVIREIPIKRKGGAVLKMPNKKNSKGYSRSLSATNKLFTQNFLFAKPKSRKNKVFDPNSKYYAEGGSLLTKKVTCKKCGWKWDAEDGGKDITTCHECGGQGLVHAQDGGLHKFAEGGNPCPEGYVIDPITGECIPNGGTLPKDYSQFQSFSETLPSNLQDPDFKYGNPDQYNLYGMWETAGKPQSFQDVQDSDYFPLQDDGSYHGFTVGSDGEFLKPMSHGTTWKEVMNSQLNIDPYFQQNRIIKNEQGRLQYVPKKQYGGIGNDYIETDLDENEIEEYRKGGYIVEEIDNYQDGGTYTVKGSKGNYKKVNGKWQVDWNRSGKYQPLSKGDVKARTAILDKMAKPVNDGMSKVSSNSSDNTKVNYQKPLVESFNRSNNLESFYKKEREKDLQKQKDATAYHDKTNKISDNFTPKAKENLKNSPVIDNKYFINSQKNPIPMPDGYKPENTKLESIEMLYPEKYGIGPGGGLAGLGMKASKAAFAFKPISYLPSVGKALTYHSVYDATTNHIPNTVKLLSDKSKWNNDKSVELFKNLFKITSTAAGFSKYDKLKYFNRARNVGQFIDKGTDANKDALKGTKMLKNFVTTFKKYGGLQKTSNFQKGGTWTPNDDFFPKKNKTQKKVTPSRDKWKNVTVESNNGKPSYRKEDYIDQVQSEDPKTKAAGLAMQAEHQKQLKAIQAKEQAEIIKQRELLYQQMIKEDQEQLIKEQNKPLLLQISENNKYTPIGEKPKPFVPFKKPGLMEIPIDYESTPGAIASKDERINMFIDKKKKDYLNQTIKKNGADVILSLQDEYMKKINSDKKFRDSNISYDDYLLEKLSDPTYKYKDELINIYKQKYNENTNFIQKGFDNVADFLSDPLNSLENDIWAGENARIPQSRFIVRDPNSPFYDATNERLQYDSSPLNSMLNYVNPFSSAAEANVDYSKGNYSNMFGNLAEIPFKAVGALAAPEVLASVTALPTIIGGTTVGTLLNAGFVGLGAYEAVEGPLANNISEAVTSGLTNDWRKAINEGLLVSSYFLGLGEVSEAIGLATLNNTGKAKNFLPLTLQQYRDLKALSKVKPLQQVSALQKFTDSKIATDAEIIDINNISKPVQSFVDGTVSQRTIPQMMERPALPKPNNIYQQPNFVSDNPGLNALDYLPRVADERNLAQNALSSSTNLENVRSAANLESESQLAADFGAIDDFDFSEFGTLTAEEIAALRKEMDEAYHVNTSGPYDDPVNSNLETDMNSFIPTVTGYRPPPSELIIPSTIPSNGAANSVNMNLFPGYNSSGIAASIQSPWETSFNTIDESFKAIKEYIVDNNIGNGVGDGQDMLKLMSKAGIDENAIQSLADSFDSRGYNYSVPNLNEVEFGSFIHDVTTGIIPLEISPLLPDAINSVIPYLRGTSANVVTSAGPPRTYLGNINSYKPKTVTHTFENGETLASLADKYNVSERSLLVENRISSTADLRPGQEIIISKMKPIESGSYEFTLAQQNMGSSSQKQGMHKTIDETLKDSSLAKDFKLEMKSDVAKTDAKEMKNFLKDLMKDDAYDAEIYKEVKNGVDQNMNNASAYIGYGDTGTKNIYKLKDLKSIINTEDLDKSIKYTKKAFDLLYANQKTLDLNQLKLLRSLQIKLYDLYGTNYIRKILPLREGITDEKVLSELNGLSMQNKGLQAPVGWKNIINKEGEVIATIQIGHMDQGVVISQTGLKLKYHGYNWKYDKNPLTGLEFQNKDEALAALTERLKIVTGEMIQIDRDTWNEVYRNSPISEAEAHEKAKKMMENLDFNNKVGYGKALYGMVNYAAEQMGFGKLMTEAHFAPTTFPSPVTGKPVTAFRARNLWESKSTTDVDGKNVRRFLNANEIEGDRSGRNFYMNYKKGGDPSKLKMFI